MRITWRGLELPTRVESDKTLSTETYGRFAIEPFERGFGTTIGNSLRRVLLSSLEGAAVTSVRIKGADHEFTSIKGVAEDVTEIILNIKTLVLKKSVDGPRVISLSADKTGQVRADAIVCEPGIEIVNKDNLIATLTEDVKFEIEMTVENGRGYSAAAERLAEEDSEEQEHGNIEIDAIYSPVTRVRYKTEDTRVGQKTNFDKLILEIWTNGTVEPAMAMVEAAKILRKHINPFVQYFELGEETIEEEFKPEEELTAGVDEELAAKLAMPIQELELSVRASNCLEASRIETVGELVRLTEADILKLRSFGKTSLREVKRKLADMGLYLGMTDID